MVKLVRRGTSVHLPVHEVRSYEAELYSQVGADLPLDMLGSTLQNLRVEGGQGARCCSTRSRQFPVLAFETAAFAFAAWLGFMRRYRQPSVSVQYTPHLTGEWRDASSGASGAVD